MSKKNLFLKSALAVSITAGLAACGGGGDSTPSTNEVVEPTSTQMTPTSELQGNQIGSFQDSAVEGLTYWTASNGLGVTGQNGSFNFEPGEVIALYLGNELVTVTDAELISTPMNTLSVRNITEAGVGHPHQALNVLRLLQTIDAGNDTSSIVIPKSFHLDRNEAVLGLDFAQDTESFATSGKILNDILTTASKQGASLVARTDAVAHFKQTLENLNNNLIDLRGTWVATSSYMKQFGKTPAPSCVDVGPATSIVGDDTVFLYGSELHSETDSNGNITCTGKDYSTQDTSDSPDVETATRDGETGFQWSIADRGALDFGCGPTCTLAELRGTIDDWDETCLANDFYTTKNEGDVIDHFQDVDYCDESDQHNGPIVGFSEVTYVDRLGGDRILRLKRDFFASFAPAETAERATAFSENGFSLEVSNRQEALNHTVDLTQGEWVEKLISATDSQTIEKGTYSFPTDGASIALKCASGFASCTWSELNDSYEDGAGNDVQYIHIRGTNVINWVEGDTVGTLTLTANN